MQEWQMLHNTPGHEGPQQTQHHHCQRERRSYLVSTIHLERTRSSISFSLNPSLSAAEGVLSKRAEMTLKGKCP
jgi:hypothetical protein